MKSLKLQKKNPEVSGKPPFLMAGFTLLEILISTGIVSLVLVFVISFSLDVSTFGLFFGSNLEAQQDLQQAMKILAAEIRSVGVADHGGYPITLTTNTAFTFFSDVDDDGKFEQVRYFLDGTTLKRGITKSSGIPPVYNPADEGIRDAARYVSNGATPIFSYYTKDYTGTEPALVSPADPSIVRLIHVSLTIDKDPLSLPGPMTAILNATIRSMRDNLQ